ncbi:hypothetical protein I302_103283 [Kwoniella bestiolae CBS 10118]|uniref:SGNH hydrolase-type esterase domain-containing protein n=1 Tax=Kwoniella bestiolae CBS 10118 TaxID=1296100 RepID=A0AAJ8K5S2_9TREE
MLSTAIYFLFLIFPLIVSSISLPHSYPSKDKLPGKFVPFSKLSTCPTLSDRKPPKNAKDVRPDDFKVVMAMGDSITAGLLARGSRDDYTPSVSERTNQYRQRPFDLGVGRIPEIAEWRGISYPIGSDEGAITIPTILQHYSKPEGKGNITGVSTGHHPPISCLGIGCAAHPEEDGLNAAISGSLSKSLIGQVKDYLIPKMIELEVRREDWKYVNLGIGANDACAFCLTPNSTAIPLHGSPQQFAKGIKKAVNELRKHAPNMIVNIIGMFRVSDIYELTLKDPYCQPPHLPIPHLALECSCALIPGPVGDYTRQKMDELGEAYDQAVWEVIKEWEEEDDPSFAAIWQPGTSVDLANYPIEALSKIDCFHPSELSHQRVASGLWNRLTLGMKDKYQPIPWEQEPTIRCLEESDRIRVGEVSKMLRRD